MKILLTNDDGIHSRGLRALAKSLESIGDIWVVAPDREMSAASHSLTLHRPLRIKEVVPQYFCVDGTPTDCICLGVHKVLEERPDLIVSGINKGGNLASDIFYSGTVSAAREGTMMGIPSFAISLVSQKDFKFQTAARFAQRLARYILDKGIPKGTFLNVNVPGGEINKEKPYKITKQGRRISGGSIIEKVDPRGEKYYWFGNNHRGFENITNSDSQAIAENSISITPLHLELTDYSFMKDLAEWVSQ